MQYELRNELAQLRLSELKNKPRTLYRVESYLLFHTRPLIYFHPSHIHHKYTLFPWAWDPTSNHCILTTGIYCFIGPNTYFLRVFLDNFSQLSWLTCSSVRQSYLSGTRNPCQPSRRVWFFWSNTFKYRKRNSTPSWTQRCII